MSKAPVLVVAAHPDDEVLGCGGTIARLAREGHPVHVMLIADGESSRDDFSNSSDLIDARGHAAHRAGEALGCASVTIHALPDNQLDSVTILSVAKLIEAKIAEVRPHTVFTHNATDVNVDHKIVHEAILAACRPQPGHSVRRLYFFEVASSTEWRPPGSAIQFSPNYFVELTDEDRRRKTAALEAYHLEMRAFPHPRSIEATEALAKWRGATVGVHSAEGFVLGREIT